MNILKILAEENNLTLDSVKNTVNLLDSGASVPFIARYRKDVTNNLDDVTIRKLAERLDYLRKLEERKNTILSSIKEQGKLTDELSKKIEDTLVLAELEDIYRPYKPKRQTRGQIAIKAGLAPLAKFIKTDLTGNLELEAKKYLNEENKVTDTKKAISMALDILAEEISDKENYRTFIKKLIYTEGKLDAKLVSKPEKDTYNNYDNFSCLVSKVKPHQVLAIFRGEKQKCLSKTISLDEEYVLSEISKLEIKKNSPYFELLTQMITDSLKRLIYPSVFNDVYNDLFTKAEDSSIETFKVNLEELLMVAPLKSSVVLGFDPGYTNGCKLAIVNEFGKVIYTGKTFVTIHKNAEQIEKDRNELLNILTKFKVKYIALGNGTASRESEAFIMETIKDLKDVDLVIVNEAGASIWSASKDAQLEFPDYDVALRSAVSIARRLIDPLSELVKIAPESIGVGQYQYDMNQVKLANALKGVVEDCVNKVGVNVNYASKSLLSYVSGIGPALANEIVEYRLSNGKFKSREDLKKVKKFGPKAFLNAAGFLRITDGTNPLDSTSIHPESYPVTLKLLKELKVNDLNDAKKVAGALTDSEIEALSQKLSVGYLTLKDIVNELIKPARDPRTKIVKAQLKSNITSIDDLKEGMILEGTVRNIMDFGFFVDIGVHVDGLVHISEISNKQFIKNIPDFVHISDIVKVKVIGIDKKRKRISLSMKQV